MRYRWADVTGRTYFFTVNLAERKRTLLVEHVNVLRNVIRPVRARHPFHIDAMMILPDHLHAVRTLPTGDSGYSTWWMLIKAGFSRQMVAERSHSMFHQFVERGGYLSGLALPNR
jgi:REP-associated tyrosine transposase